MNGRQGKHEEFWFGNLFKNDHLEERKGDATVTV
jgi:hypothetical protein